MDTLKVIDNYSDVQNYINTSDTYTPEIINSEIAKLKHICSYPEVVMGLIDQKESQMRLVKNQILIEVNKLSMYDRLVNTSYMKEQKEELASLKSEVFNLKKELVYAFEMKDKAQAKINLYERVGM